MTEDGQPLAINVLANDRVVGDRRGSIMFATQGEDGRVAITAGRTSLTYRPKPDFCGPDSFTYGLRGRSKATVSITVTCVDDPPLAIADSMTIAEDDPATSIDVLANDADADGGPKSIGSVGQGQHGTVAISGGGSALGYEPQADFCGADSFEYALAPGGSTATVSITVTCVDDPPLAIADSVTIAEDDPATSIDVLADDTDIDGGPRAIASVTQGDNGTVAITDSGAGLTYVPQADFCGADAFEYALAPGGSKATVSVTVTCIDDPPHAVADSKTLAEDDPATSIDVLANDTEPDGGSKTVASVTQGAHGTVAITNSGADLTYEPASGYCGSDHFEYAVNGGSTATVTVEVTCSGNPPGAVADSKTLAEDAPATSIDVLANDADADGGGPKSIESVTQGQHGTVAISGGGSALSYEPQADFCGPDSFEYTLAPQESSATVSIAVTCVDDPPVAADDDVSFTEDDSASTLDLLADDTDIDGGPKVIASVTQGEHGTVAITHSGADLTYEPRADYCGTDSFEYTLAPGGSTATVSVTVACLEADTAAVQISTSPDLFPLGFDRTVDDYAIRCNNKKPVEVDASVAPGYSVNIDRNGERAGVSQAQVPLRENQEFTVTVSRGQGQHRYFIRCLPSDFGTWDYTQFLEPSHRLYVVAPAIGAVTGNYVVLFDDHGVPLWWYKATETPFDAAVLAGGNIAWTEGTLPLGTAEIRDLDGDLIRAPQTVGSVLDPHELQELPNGDLILVSYPVREKVDLTSIGGGKEDKVLDALIQEIDPQGDVVWSWNSKDHIPLSDTPRRWYENAQSFGPEAVRDLLHINAVEPDGADAFLISMRHTDAVYKIDKATGNVVWKLGGEPTSKSLTVLDDPLGTYPLGAQHDVRLLPGGTITIYDNETGLTARTPRAVRYEIDEAAKTATLLEEISDPLAASSFCCGSARRSADGSWLISWGGAPLVSEFDAAGERAFKLEFGEASSYRATSAPDGLLLPAALRAGMNAMHPR